MATSLSSSPTLLRTSPMSLLLPGRNGIISPVSLLEAIQATVRNIPDLKLHPIAVQPGGAVLQPKVLLGVLTYFYTTEVVSSSELGKRLLADPGCRAVLGGEFPDPCEIRTFRKRNRAILEECVVAALRFLEEQKMQQDGELPPDEIWLADESRRRILMAACLDSMELDDDCFSW